MKKFALAFIFSSYVLNAIAQNFLNGDFENHTATFDQINLSNAAFNSMMANTTAFGTYGDMDIITTATWSGLAQSGNWYVAFTGSGTDMIAMELSAPLVAGNSYTIRFYDRADAGFIPFPFEIGLSTNPTSLGTAIYTAPTAATVGVWTPRNFTFTAPNNGQYITVTMVGGALGNWAHTDNFTFLCSMNLGPDTSLCAGGSYTMDATTPGATAYLWQDGSTNPTFTATTPGLYWAEVNAGGCTLRDTVIITGTSGSLNLGNDTTICSGNTVVLNAATGGATAYLWQDNSTNATYTVTQTGTYWTRVTAGGCDRSDTITVTVTSGTAVNLGNDTSICAGNSVVLDATIPGATGYLWQDNSTGATYTATQTGTYWARVTVTGCISMDTISITVITAGSLNLGNDTTICTGSTIVLNATTPGATYLWQDNSTNATYTVSQTGTYWARITIGSCIASDTVTVTVVNGTPVNLGNDTAICPGNPVVLNATTPGATAYLWHNNSSNPSYTATQPGTYWVRVTAGGCISSDTILVTALSAASLNLGNDTTVCAGATVLLDATMPGATAYLWHDNSTGATYTASQTGTYWVRVTTGGCIASDTVTVSVYQVPPQSFSTNPATACVNQPVDISYTGNSAASATYVWNFNGGTIISGTGQGPYTVSWNSTGTINVTLDVTDNGCIAPQVSQQVTINPGIVANAGPDVTVCSSGSVQLGGATTAGHSYQWSPATGLSQTTIADPVYHSQNTGTVPVTTQYVLTESFNGCPGNDTVHVTLNPPAPTTISASGPVSFCDGGSVDLTADSVYSVYQWNNSSTSNSITVTQAGSFFMLAVDAAGCEFISNTLQVLVNPNPTITSTINDESCFGFNDGSITINTLNGTAPYLYTWNNGQSTPTASALSPGNYDISVYDVNQCSVTGSYAVAAAQPFNMVINQLENVRCYGAADGGVDLSGNGGVSPYQYNWSNGNTSNIVLNLGPGSYHLTISDANNCTIDSSFVITEPPAISLTPLVFDSVHYTSSVVLALPTSNNYTYQWSPTHSLSCSDCAAPEFSGANNTLYHVTATDANGCTAVTTVQVNVITDKQVFAPNAFSPNGDGQNDQWLVSSTGVVYFNVAVFNRWGEKVFETNNLNEGWDGTYKGKNTYAGVYVYTLNVTFLDGENRKSHGGITLIR